MSIEATLEEFTPEEKKPQYATDDTQPPREPGEPPKEPGEPPEKKELTEVEKVAAKLGWRPEQDFTETPENFVDAETFILRTKDIQDTMRGHLKDQRRQIKDMSTSIEDIKIHNKQVMRAKIGELTEKVEALKSQKKEAIEDGKVEAVEKIDKEIDNIKGEIVEFDKSTKETKGPEKTEKFDEWQTDNPWYGQDEEMTSYADAQANLPEYEGIKFEKMTKMVTTKVKQMFPDYFKKGGATPPASPVEKSTRTNKKGAAKTFTVADLTENQRRTCNDFVKKGFMTEQDYINDLATTGELG